MSSQVVPMSSSSKHLFLPSSSPLSSLFGSKRTKLARLSRARGPEGSSPVRGPVAEVKVVLECIFAGVDHSEEDCTGQCFENPTADPELVDNDDVDDALVGYFSGAGVDVATNNSSQIVRSPQAAQIEESQVIYISSDAPEADEDTGSVWSMHPATSENNGMETDSSVNIATDIADVFFHRGDDQLIGGSNYPTVIYINRRNGKVYQSVVNRELFFFKRELFGFEERPLWLQTNIYIGALMDKCVNETSDPFETFPILHRHGNNLAITGEELADESEASSDLKRIVRRGWERLVMQYGDLNDIQQEQKALIDKVFYLLNQYQRAIVTRDLVNLFKINAMLDPLREALNELALNEYVVRELFYQDIKPQFVDAISVS